MAELRRIGDVVWQIDARARADMRVPARVFADDRLIDAIQADDALEQLQNVATLPGIVEAAMAMPDVHQGYGFRSGPSRPPSCPTVSCPPVAWAMTSTAVSACSPCR